LLQEAQLPQRNSASATHIFLGWLTDHDLTVLTHVSTRLLPLIHSKYEKKS